MKNKFLGKFLLSVLIVMVLVSVYIVSTLEIRKLNKVKVQLEDSLKLVSNKINEKQVEIQKLSAEDRIVKFAIDSLKLGYNNEGFFEIKVDKNRARNIEKKVNSLYE